MLFVATILDGSMRGFALAYAIAPVENADNWAWFLCLLLKSVDNIDDPSIPPDFLSVEGIDCGCVRGFSREVAWALCHSFVGKCIIKPWEVCLSFSGGVCMSTQNLSKLSSSKFWQPFNCTVFCFVGGRLLLRRSVYFSFVGSHSPLFSFAGERQS